MGNLLSSNSTSSTPRLYEGIKLLLADSEKDFPREFNPKLPPEKLKLKKVSREGFIRAVERENGRGLVDLDDFDIVNLQVEQPEDVQLRNDATYIVVLRRGKSHEKRFESIEVWQRNQTSADERMLVKRAMEELEKNPEHTNARPWCKKTLTGPDGWSAEVDAVAIADGCVIFVEHKNVMDSDAADQLIRLLAKVDAYKDDGEGSVADFSGLVIKGALAGPRETSNPSDRKEMNSLLHRNNCYKWFDEKSYGDDPCSPFQASGVSCDAPAPSDSPGNGPTAPAAVPRRVGRLLAPMRGSAMLVRPRLANRVAGCRSSF